MEGIKHSQTWGCRKTMKCFIPFNTTAIICFNHASIGYTTNDIYKFINLPGNLSHFGAVCFSEIISLKQLLSLFCHVYCGNGPPKWAS